MLYIYGDITKGKHFIRNMGQLVVIQDGHIKTIWDGLGVFTEMYPYNVVADAMAKFVRDSRIKNIYRTRDGKYGAEQTTDNINKDIKWNHFHGEVPAKFVNRDAGPLLSRMESNHQVFKRGVTELSPAAIVDVLDLIKQKALYRGDEHLRSINAFQKLQAQFTKLNSDEARDVFLWNNINAAGATFRNSVIGTLIVDLSKGVELETAVSKFEAKVAPENYKRPKALITPKMVEGAVAKLEELGLTDAVNRRYATLEDMSVNNVLFVDNEAAQKMQGGLTDLLMASAKKPVRSYEFREEISIADFMENVLPNTTALELVLQNNQLSNFVSLTAPQSDDSGNLFKWDNNFAWSYDGDVADSSIRAEVSRLGGRVDGVFRFSHSWNYDKRNSSLMDLHVFMPANSTTATNGKHDNYGNNERVGWNNRKHAYSGGVQDVDYVDAAPAGYVPVENITFPDLSRMRDGEYICKIHNWEKRSHNSGGFKAEIEFNGQVFEYEYDKPLGNKEWVTVAVVTLKKGVFTIEHHLKPSSASKEKWGVSTLEPVRVSTLMFSPNYWDGRAIGNQHYFFMLENCKNPDATRGIYNEFLTSALEPHRKVFEILGSKTKCAPSDEQLSGVGLTDRGNLSTEQLFDLNLKQLDTVARRVNKAIKAEGEESFIEENQSETQIVDNLRLEILKSVIAAKQATIKAVETRAARATRRRDLEAALAAKEGEELASKSAEEIRAELDALST